MARRSTAGVRDAIGGFLIVVGIGAIDELASLFADLTGAGGFPWDEFLAVALGATIGWAVSEAARRPWLVLVPAVLLAWILLAFHIGPLPGPPWVDEHVRGEPLRVGLALLSGVLVYGGAIAARSARR